MTLPVKITQWVDGDRYGALVSVDPATVLPALAEALDYHWCWCEQHCTDPEVTAALTVTLDADQITNLAEEACEAEFPPRCCVVPDCDNFADPTGGDYCPRCSSAVAHHEQDSEDRA